MPRATALAPVLPISTDLLKAEPHALLSAALHVWATGISSSLEDEEEPVRAFFAALAALDEVVESSTTFINSDTSSSRGTLSITLLSGAGENGAGERASDGTRLGAGGRFRDAAEYRVV